jgi:sterol desaturase/sphingolipid hydroxylase (fatty acid hydroxylase superfamily)
MVFQSIGFFTPLLFFEMDWISFGLALLFVNVKGLLRHDKRGSWLMGDHHLLHHRFLRGNFGEKWLDQLGGTLLKEAPTEA